MSRPLQWRYVLLGAGFLGLAAVRATQGAALWAVVFLTAAAVNAWLAVHEARPARDRAGQDGPAREGGGALGVERSAIERSLAGYRTSRGQWKGLAVACLLIGAGLLLLEPPLAVFAGGAALFAVLKARRAGQAVATLQRARLVQE
jgi:hypothetical protein